METMASIIFHALLYLVAGGIIALIVGVVKLAQGEQLSWRRARRIVATWPLYLLMAFVERFSQPALRPSHSAWRPWFAWRPVFRSNEMILWVWVLRRRLISPRDGFDYGHEYCTVSPNDWQPWFAWHPVRLWKDNSLVWWRPLERIHDWPSGAMGEPIRYETKYREPNA